MIRNTLTNWWGVLTAALGGLVLVAALAVLGVGVEDGDGLLVTLSAGGALSGALVLAGLAAKARRPRVASWMIVVGIIGSALLAGWLVLLGAIVLAGGVWTGNLQLSEGGRTAVPVVPDDFGAARRWYLWLIASLVLFGLGLVGLVLLGDGETATGSEDTSVVAGLAWFAWTLGWLGAAVSLGIGVVLGSIRALGRHHTRLA